MWGLWFKIAIAQIQDDDTSCQHYDFIFHIFFNLQLIQGPQYVYYHVQPLFQDHEGYTKCHKNAITI